VINIRHAEMIMTVESRPLVKLVITYTSVARWVYWRYTRPQLQSLSSTC